MVRFLVLGSEGVVGSSFCKHVESLGHETIHIDIKISPKYHDLRNQDNSSFIKQQIDKSDFVLFAAYDVGGSKYINYSNPEVLSNNMLIMSNTFPLLKGKKFIFLSTQMVHIDNNTYGISKKIGESYTRELGGLVVRLWNVYGHEEFGDKSHVITDLILKAKSGSIDILSEGKEVRQFLYEEDCAKGLLSIFNNYSQLINKTNVDLTNFEWNSVLDVANIISELFNNVKITTGNISNIQKPVDPDPYILTIWKPEVSLKEGITRIMNKMNEKSINKYCNPLLDQIIRTTFTGKGDSDSHHLTLLALVVQLKAKNILELGVRSGSTTLPLLYGASITNGKVISVDINETEFNCPVEYTNQWTFIKSDAIKFLENYKSDKPWDLVYIDDWHSYDHVKKELEILDKQVSPRTVILLHDLMYADYQPHYHTDLAVKSGQWANGGPYRAVSELDTNFWEFSTIPVCNGLTILRKKYSKLYFS